MIASKYEDLTNEELIKIARVDKEAKEYFFSRNDRLNYYIAKKYESSGVEREELVALSSFGMLKAFNTFDTEKNIKFATYATMCMNNEILMFLRKHKKYKGNQSLDLAIKSDSDGNELTLAELLPSEESYTLDSYIENSALYELVKDFQSRNNFQHNYILKHCIMDNRSQHEIANELNISQSYVSRVAKKISKKLAIIAPKYGFDNQRREEKMAKINKEEAFYIVSKHPYLNEKEMAKILDCSTASIFNYKKRLKDGVDFAIPEKIEKLDNIIANILKLRPEKKTKPIAPITPISEVKVYVENAPKEMPAPKVESIIEKASTPIKAEVSTNIISTQDFKLSGTPEEIANMLYGLSQQVRNMPSKSKISLATNIIVKEG